jgi:hypothetical protein
MTMTKNAWYFCSPSVVEQWAVLPGEAYPTQTKWDRKPKMCEAKNIERMKLLQILWGATRLTREEEKLAH